MRGAGTSDSQNTFRLEDRIFHEIWTADEYFAAQPASEGVTATSMDTLSIPSGGSVDTTALIVSDYSNGNDAVIIKGDGDLASLAGKPVNLVELSVSHYLLARALDSVDLSEADLAGYQAQLASTEMFFTPADAIAFTSGAELPETMTNVAEFLFDKGILGEGAPSADFVGVEFPHACDQYKAKPPACRLLKVLTFVLVFNAYAIGSDIRLTANPSDKLLPAPSTIHGPARSAWRLASGYPRALG